MEYNNKIIWKDITDTIKICQRILINQGVSISNRTIWYDKLWGVLNKQQSLSPFKKSRWEYDSIIMKISSNSKKHKEVLVKIHDEMFPFASNILENNIK